MYQKPLCRVRGTHAESRLDQYKNPNTFVVEMY